MKKVRFGLVGTGRISDWVLKGAVLEPRFEAAAVCSRTEENAEAFAARHGIPKIFTDVEKMASDPSVDAVYIGTPNNTHHDLAIKCLDHGKHVICEKPLASNAREVREMVAAAKANGVVLMEAMISTLSPNFRMVQEKVTELGPVRNYSGTFCQFSSKYDLLKNILSGESDSPVPSSFNPDRSSGPATKDITVPCDPDEYLCEFKEFIDVIESGRPESANNSLANSLTVAGIMDEIRRQAGIIFPAD